MTDAPEPAPDELAPDELGPGAKDPAEGSRGPAEGAPPVVDSDESHLGAGGDPAEGARED